MAYDRVSRNVLFMILKRVGCGTVMLAVLVSMYSVTQSVLGTAVMAATIGVRQGSPSSCVLFIIYVNEFIALIKNKCGTDGLLTWLHILMLMDDTVLFSSTRHGMECKLRLLNEYCQDYGMLVNNKKTKFFALNCSPEERRSFTVGEMVVDWCESYMYLGSIFTCDGSVSSAAASQERCKTAHVLKFV